MEIMAMFTYIYRLIGNDLIKMIKCTVSVQLGIIETIMN